ncbi:hypothetical protein F5Y16DRAFT_397079 [Xylariaceae sp. FL0255]|nr:hypothetical protein F5Y16DRAFT_397079 [Xylariaceae sp. FL0255]
MASEQGSFVRDAISSSHVSRDDAPSPQQSPPSGPPYMSQYAVVGGLPAPGVDNPIAGVFLFLFLVTGLAHLAILQINRRRGLKFFFSGMLFGLSILRCVALAMRIGWASFPHDINVAIAANILTQTGSVLIFIINLIFAQRIVRAYHGSFGWSRITRSFFWFLFACVGLSLLMLIIVTVDSFFTLDPHIQQEDRTVQLFAGTYLALLAFLPIPIVLLSWILPRRYDLEKFGAGRWRSKLRLLLFTSAVASLGAGFRIGTNFDPRPLAHPAWYHSRACYYGFNFVTDLVVSIAYLVARFDRRFIVPNGAKGPGDYSSKDRRNRVHFASPTSSVSESSGGNETDPEKLAKIRNSGAGIELEKDALTLGGKDRGYNMGGRQMPGRRSLGGTRYSDVRLFFNINSEADAFGPSGQWDGAPWPPPVTPWFMPRRYSAPPGDLYGLEDYTTDVDYSPTDCEGSERELLGNLEDLNDESTKCAGSVIQEPEAAYVPDRDYGVGKRPKRHFNPHPLQQGNRHPWGASYAYSCSDVGSASLERRIQVSDWPLPPTPLSLRMGSASGESSGGDTSSADDSRNITRRNSRSGLEVDNQRAPELPPRPRNNITSSSSNSQSRRANSEDALSDSRSRNDRVENSDTNPSRSRSLDDGLDQKCVAS